MSFVHPHRQSMFLLLACAPLALFAVAGAQEAESPKKKAPPSAEEVAPPVEGEPEAEPVDRYAVPDGDVDQLLKFIGGLQKYRPTSMQDYLQHRSKAGKAITEAAQKILDLKPEQDSEAFRTATLVLLQQRIGAIGNASKKERTQVIQEVKDRIGTKEPDDVSRQEAGLVMGLAKTLERSGQTELAAKIYREFGEQFAKSSNEQLAGLGRMLEGSGRRVDLVGKEMKIEGTTVEGDAFDWASYRGKVVLVDFWATWCGPCRAEMPNVRKNYDSYHDQGFDVVGISVDRDRDALEKFLAKEKTPWVTLHEKGGKGHPVAEYYGVTGIPTVMLVDREGKVVSLRARGPELGRLLEELIGPPSPQTPPETPDEAEKSETGE